MIVECPLERAIVSWQIATETVNDPSKSKQERSIASTILRDACFISGVGYGSIRSIAQERVLARAEKDPNLKELPYWSIAGALVEEWAIRGEMNEFPERGSRPRGE